MQKKLLIMLLLLVGIVYITTAEDIVTTIEKSQVTISSVKDAIDGDYEITIDDDGDLLLYDGEYYLYAILNTKNSYISFFTSWVASESLSEIRGVKLVNKWNAEKVFAKAIFNTSDTGNRLQLRYHLSFEGGLNVTNFNDAIKWMYALADAFNTRLVEEDAL